MFSENKLAVSLIFVIAALLLRWAIAHHLKKRPSSDDDDVKLKRRLSNVDFATQILLIAGLVLIWLSEIQYFALSIAAFIVALVIATREFIQGILGSLYLANSRLLVIGDLVRVNSHCGEVVRRGWLNTTLLELDLDSPSYSYTGRTLVLPNHTFVSHPITKLNLNRRFVGHSFTLVREAEEINFSDARSHLLERAHLYCQPFSEEAQRFAAKMQEQLDCKSFSIQPSVRLSTSNLGKNVMVVTFFAPTGQAVELEQKLTDDFFQFWYEQGRKKQLKNSTTAAPATIPTNESQSDTKE